MTREHRNSLPLNAVSRRKSLHRTKKRKKKVGGRRKRGLSGAFQTNAWKYLNRIFCGKECHERSQEIEKWERVGEYRKLNEGWRLREERSYNRLSTSLICSFGCEADHVCLMKCSRNRFLRVSTNLLCTYKSQVL